VGDPTAPLQLAELPVSPDGAAQTIGEGRRGEQEKREDERA
jgi:hypothetical protein